MTTAPGTPVTVLSRALDQTGDVLAQVHREHLHRRTPCHDWDVEHLVNHLVGNPARFLQMMAGQEPDWAAEPEAVSADWAAAFRVAADDLIHVWHSKDPSETAGADWQTAEFAVHTWDLARAIGRSTDDLDHEVAERGLTFMRANLTDENRGAAFAPEQPASPGGSAYDELAAFAGREV